MSVAEPKDLLHCTFCDKSQRLVRKLIAGPGVYICDECVALCNDIVEEEFEVDRLDELRRMTARADELVERLRADGVPWDDIAAALRKEEGE